MTVVHSAEAVLETLRRDGVLMLPKLVPGELVGMQRSFAVVLKRQRCNNVDGYVKTERFRHGVPDVLMLDQGFVDVPL